MRNKVNHKQSRPIPFKSKIKVTNRSRSLRKKPTLRDATTGFPAKWRLSDKRRTSMLMTCHYTDLGSAFNWLKKISLTTKPMGISMEFLRSFLRRHFTGTPVVASRNVESFLRLPRKKLNTIKTDMTLNWSASIPESKSGISESQVL